MNQRAQTLGALAWLLSLQYYVVQIVVATAWGNKPAFSWTANTISDLGNTVCGPYNGRLVCSPLHGLMNASFILLGLTMITGTLLLWRSIAKKLTAKIAMVCLHAAGAGTIIVGFFPENTVAQAHFIGAALPFVLGNLGMLLLGFKGSFNRSLRRLSLAAGSFGLLSLVVFLVIGGGGLERLVAYPQSIWMSIVGAILLLSKSGNQVDGGGHDNRSK